MQKLHHLSDISNGALTAADPSAVVVRRLARRFRLSASHAILVAHLAGLGATAKEARQ